MPLYQPLASALFRSCPLKPGRAFYKWVYYDALFLKYLERKIFNIHLSLAKGVNMSKDQVLGAVILIVSAIVILAYLYLVFLTEFSILLLKITGAVAVVAVFGILGWIGYTLATTPPPKPIEEIEKEVEEELKKIEEEEKKEEEKKETEKKE